MEEQMQWTDLTRRLAKLSAASTLVLAACGGGDKNLGPETGGDVDTWDMVALGNAGLPAEAEVEDCRLTRFDHGTLELREDGAWRITLQVNDVSGDWGYHDEGEFQSNGDTGWFRSQITGTTYQATYDGTDLRIDYDWCENGVPDVQFVFE
jgi:hypothetical protein